MMLLKEAATDPNAGDLTALPTGQRILCPTASQKGCCSGRVWRNVSSCNPQAACTHPSRTWLAYKSPWPASMPPQREEANGVACAGREGTGPPIGKKGRDAPTNASFAAFNKKPCCVTPGPKMSPRETLTRSPGKRRLCTSRGQRPIILHCDGGGAGPIISRWNQWGTVRLRMP